jgi:hypothetical protein
LKVRTYPYILRDYSLHRAIRNMEFPSSIPRSVMRITSGP